LNEHYCNLVPYKITAISGIAVPSYGSKLFRHIEETVDANSRGDGGDRFAELIYDARGMRKRQEMVGQLHGHIAEFGRDARENAHLSFIGERDRIHDYEYRDRNQKKLRAGAAHWQLLWQICSDFKVGTCIHDTGEFNIFIRRRDLAKRDFSRVYVEIDGG
jgi:hypothetical protein